MKTTLVALLALILASCSGGGPSATQAPLSSMSDAEAWFTGNGFTGSQSTLSDGSLQWQGQGADSSTGEVDGTAAGATKVALTVPGSAGGGTVVTGFLNNFAPGSGSLIDNVLVQTRESGPKDQSDVIDGHNVEVKTTGTAQQFQVTLTVD